jgi:CspA family cold shock protein
LAQLDLWSASLPKASQEPCQRALSAVFSLPIAPIAVLLLQSFIPGSADVATGSVKWFNSQKGYGFIQPDGGGGKDVFVHISAVEKAGLSSLNEGAKVSYEIVNDRGKESAGNLRVG